MFRILRQAFADEPGQRRCGGDFAPRPGVREVDATETVEPEAGVELEAVHLRRAEVLALAEGWENALAWAQLGRGDHIEGLSLGAAIDLGNLSGRALGSVAHRWLKGPDGKKKRIANGKPDPAAPGIIIPEGIRAIVILGDSNSEALTTTAQIAVATRRFQDHGLDVTVDWAPWGLDWNQQLLKEA